jgi:uncharacterized protein (DUF1810 family)
MPLDPDRFLAAQAPVLATVRAELAAGRKATHWMWFVFPQLAALGRSPTAKHYGLTGLPEASAYLAHPVLGPRLRDCTRLLLAHRGTAPEAILGPVDALKLRSSLTLFAAVPDADPVFGEALAAFFDGVPCPLTAAALGLG